jgi:hypothetical protein
MFQIVMPGLVPGIHVLVPVMIEVVDGRDKPGHGEERAEAAQPIGETKGTR